MPIGSIQSSFTNLWIQPTIASKNLWAQSATASKNLAATTYAPADTNQDGVVSPAELQAYELSHPAATYTSGFQSLLPSYTASGRLENQTRSGSQDRTRNLLAEPPTAARNLATATTYAAADTNHNGVVSPAERLAYELSHPAMTSSSRSRSMAPPTPQPSGFQEQTGSSVRSGSPNLLAQPARAPEQAAAMSYAPADRNQDGLVSPAERLAYELSHPSAASIGRPPSVDPAYTRRGGFPTVLSGNLIDQNA